MCRPGIGPGDVAEAADMSDADEFVRRREVDEG